MSEDTQLDELAAQLQSFRVLSAQHQIAQQKILTQCESLLEENRQLKSDYDEEKQLSEKYKRLAKGQENDPFVLVLIDGDGYIFRDHLVEAGIEGGASAAEQLRHAIKKCLPKRETEHCRVLVRIYCDLAGLSRVLAREKVVGHHGRALAPFSSSFTRSQDLFDFVDAGEEKGAADFKVREMFRLFSAIGQCKHIFFGGCHDAGYLSLLTPYQGKSDQVTLLRGPTFNPEYQKLELGIEDFTALFRSLPSDLIKPSSKPGKFLPSLPAAAPLSLPAATPTKSEHIKTGVCYAWKAIGTCKWGQMCRFPHPSDDTGNSENEKTSLQKTNEAHTTQPTQSSWTTIDRQLSKKRTENTSSDLCPRELSDRTGKIPINKDGARLDFYIAELSKSDIESYKARQVQQNPCNDYHLLGHCDYAKCVYAHSPLSPKLVRVLKALAMQQPCSAGSACRSICKYGHVCQRDGCHGQWPCRLGGELHGIDKKVAKWIKPEKTSTSAAILGKNDGVWDSEDEEVSSDRLVGPKPPPNDLLDGALDFD